MKTVIVGGVAGGMSAATRLRRLDEQAEIVVLERGPYVSFANCGLPYYVGGVIEDRSDLLLQSPETLAARFRIDVRVSTEAISIDRTARQVRVRDARTGETAVEAYDHLILAAGSRARTLRESDRRTFTLRTVDDVDAIEAVLQEAAGDASAVVIGGGFIGLEAVENLTRRGLRVALVHRGEQVFPPLDPELAALVLDELTANGVEVHLQSTVVRIDPAEVVLADGTTLPADLVIDAIGVTPDDALAREAGLAIGPSGGIAVDAHQRTSDPAIFAVGDGVEKVDAVGHEAELVTMAGLANRHGRAAADAIAGKAHASRDALGTAIIGVFAKTVATVGWSERRLRSAGRSHRVVHTHPGSHAGYYPGAEQMAMKLLIDADDDRILGAQIVGGAGVDKRIDVIAVAMSARMTASSLMDLELAYAPQYGSAKDPVNLIGYVADNAATYPGSTVQWHELAAQREAGAALIDVRSPAEFAAGHIPGALNVPLPELRDRHEQLTGPVIVHCQVGQRGHTAQRLLAQLGHHVRNLDGGYLTWRAGMAARAGARTPVAS
ncbi:MAG: FAD-dependent oxidoreductase [Acidobacteria bacterium]|nr:FAD-dependent oxidoreductase [Acidobacteriota bacterium]